MYQPPLIRNDDKQAPGGVVSPAMADGKARRFRVWPLLLGILLLFAAALAALGWALLVASREADDLADAWTADQLRAALDQQSTDIAMRNLDWAWWDEAIEKFVLNPDEIYADENLGVYANDVLGLSAALVVLPHDSFSFAYRDGARIPAADRPDWLEALAPLISATRTASSPAKPEPRTGFVSLDSDLYAVSAAAMAAEAGTGLPGWEESPAVLVFARRIDDDFLGQLSRILGLEGLAVVGPENTDRTAIDLLNPGEDTIGRLTWALNYPGARIVAALGPTAAAIAIAELAVASGLIAWIAIQARAFRRERDLREDELIAAERRATAADRAKSLFLANTSHELRTPLNAVIGFAEALRLEYLGPLNNKQQEYLSHIEDGGRHLLSVLHDVLDMARIEARREDLDEADLCPRAIIDRAIVLVEPKRDDHEFDIRHDPPDALWSLRADERRLLQMLLNVLSNALSFSPTGSVIEITVAYEETEPRETAAPATAISIRDHGPGIPEGDLAHVLEPFHRPLSHAHDGDRETNGLGLPLTRMLMELHGGELVLSNALGGGLNVVMRFPPSRTQRVSQTGHTIPDPS